MYRIFFNRFLWCNVFLIVALSVMIQCSPAPKELSNNKVDEGLLFKNFQNPPSSYGPWVLWFWINGHITREGVDADLQAMHRVGIKGVTIYSVGSHPFTRYMIGEGPVKFMTDEWQKLFEHTLKEADKLGIKVAMSVCDGFSSAGGPSITPDLGMQQLTWSDTSIVGPGMFSGKLKQPGMELGHYHDIAVFAFPSLKSAAKKMNERCSRIYTNAVTGKLDEVFDQDLNTWSTFECSRDSDVFIGFDFKTPVPCRAISIAMPEQDITQPGKFHRASSASLQTSEDGQTFHTVGTWDLFWRRRHDPTNEPLTKTNTITVRLEGIKSRYYRLIMHSKGKVDLGEIDLIPSERVHFWEAKAGYADVWGHDGGAAHYDVTQVPTSSTNNSDENDLVINQKRVINLTGEISNDGTLHWNIPEGQWTIVRMGYTPTGQKVLPATPAGAGLECNKLDPVGIETQFRSVILPLLNKAKQKKDSAFAFAHIDSWEAACQNWTPKFREEFIRLRGYDPILYFPVLAGGHVVNSLSESERFLWDFRRTIVDLIADNYYGRFRELCHEQGIRLQAEPSGAQQFLPDPITYHSMADLSMGELWYNNTIPRIDCKFASSAGHIFGKKVIGAEAFTCGNYRIAWQEDPLSLKQLGDATFCMGINHFEIHRYAHQPWMDKSPGMTFNRWGIWFERTNTWWEQSRAWLKYLSRCQYLLQQGQFMADIVCLTAEGVPSKVGYRNEYKPAIPKGFDYDACNAYTVEKLMTVKDGRITIPSGMSYKIFLLPDRTDITPQLLRKVKEMVKEGAVVVGPKPTHAPGLTNYPDCDSIVKKIAEKVWGPCDGVQVKEHQYGKGKIIWGKSFDEIFASLGINADFASNKPDKLSYTHRKVNGMDIYFVANQSDTTLKALCTFRVSGKTPEIWDPVTGKKVLAASSEQTGDDRTKIFLDLVPFQSVFVLFNDPSKTSELDDRTKLPLQESGIIPFEKIRLDGTWKVRFPVKEDQEISVEMDSLYSWTEHKNPEIKYFSGTAEYTKTFSLPESYADSIFDLSLELGLVKNIAEVQLNGHDLGILWTYPFSRNISQYARVGKNELVIKITNLWPNRLIGDSRLSESQRVSYATWQPYEADSPLFPSGLLGPVEITSQKVYEH